MLCLFKRNMTLLGEYAVSMYEKEEMDQEQAVGACRSSQQKPAHAGAGSQKSRGSSLQLAAASQQAVLARNHN